MLLGSTDSCLHHNFGVSSQPSSFFPYLFSEFSSGRDNDGANVVGGCPSCPTNTAREGGIFFDDALEERKEKSNGFTRAGPGLGNPA